MGPGAVPQLRQHRVLTALDSSAGVSLRLARNPGWGVRGSISSLVIVAKIRTPQTFLGTAERLPLTHGSDRTHDRRHSKWGGAEPSAPSCLPLGGEGHFR